MTIQEWLRKQLEDAAAEGFVIGLSGGVDSSVTATLAVDAVGADKVLGVVMPCYSSRDDKRLAWMMARRLGIKAVSIPLKMPYQPLVAILRISTDKVARGNLKARLRMTVLYAFANSENRLVLGTGNKTELVLGYFTKFGDGGVDLLPLGDMYKTEVWELARELGIPKEIIERPPSAGLWEGQTDENELGLSYSKLDTMLKLIVDGEMDTMTGISEWDKVYEMVESAKHKLAMPPIYKGE